jgi:hypothetical protein
MISVAPGRLIAGRYRLGTVVGRGGMGIVWQAHDELLGRDVAVKELTWPNGLSAAERESVRRRAVREAKAAARLSHRNIVRVFDILEVDGCPWIVMELLPATSLRDRVRLEGPLDPAEAARVGLEILAALRAAHALGIVHRDVKPANILMPGDRAVLADFGIAQDTGSAGDITTVSMIMGSPAYTAPERARGGSSAPAADLWSLGATLYAAVEGTGPFERDGGPLASLSAVIADEPEPSAHAGPLLWPVIDGLLRKDPAERLDADEAERLLVLAAAPGPAAGDGAPGGQDQVAPRRRRPVAPGRGRLTAPGRGRLTAGRRRRPARTAAVLAGTAALAIGVVSAVTAALGQSAPPAVSRPAAAGTSAAPAGTPSGPGPRHPAAAGTGTGTGSQAGTHLTSGTAPAPSVPAGSAGAGGSDGAGAEPGGAGPSGPGAPSGQGNGKGSGPGKGSGKGKGAQGDKGGPGNTGPAVGPGAGKGQGRDD